jgi:hypothetical protein
MIKKIIRTILPKEILATFRNYRILSDYYGQYKTIKNWDCVDAKDNPIPWYTYPAIEYIKQLDFHDKVVYEYGSGNSTLFWAKRCKKLISVENDKKWYEKIKRAITSNNVEYHLLEKEQEYVHSIHRYENNFDVVIIDGIYRYQCAVEALKKIRGDGFIILDNSDWKEKTSELLRQSDLIEVDMSGFGPINAYTWTTSFYFTRNVKLIPACNRQPVHGIGSLNHTES